MNALNIARNDFSEIELAAIPYNILGEHYGDKLAREQLALEHEAYELGEQRFLKMLERQVKAGEFADNVAAKPLVLTLHPQLTKRIDDWKEAQANARGKKPRAYYPIKHGVSSELALSMGAEVLKEKRGVSSEAIALLTIKVVLGTLTDASKATIQQVSSQLGKALEDEARFGRIREQEAAYFKKNVADQLDKRVGHVYKKAFMQVVEADMISKGMLGGDNWASWKTDEQMHVGTKLLELLIEGTGLVEMTKNKMADGSDDVTSMQMVQLAPAFVELLPDAPAVRSPSETLG